MRRLHLAVATVSAAALAFEIVLIRVFSVAQGYHFAFMAVSLGLLGYGISGTLIAVLRGLRRGAPTPILFAASLGFSVALPGSYFVNNTVPFDSYQIGLDPRQLLFMGAYFLILALPFVLAGLVVGVALLGLSAGPVYGASLLGSGLGSIVALVALPVWGGEGAVLICGVLGAVAAALLAKSRGQLVATLLVGAGLGAGLVWMPEPLAIRLSPYKPLAAVQRFLGSELVHMEWNAFSRVEVVEGPAIRSAPGLSLAYRGAVPDQVGLTVDGDDLRPISRASDPATAVFLEHLLTALPYRLGDRPEVLLLEPGGGQDLLLALRMGAERVVAVEPNPTVAKIVRERYADFSGGIYLDPRVALVSEIGRSYVAGTEERFDVVHLSLGDAFRPVTSGAYSLGEDYGLTVEAFRGYLGILKPDGILAAPRWLQQPPSEGLRVLALAQAALEAEGVSEPEAHLVALRSFSTSLLLAKESPFSQKELEVVRGFAQERSFDLILYPGMSPAEANRVYVLETPEYHRAYRELLTSDDRDSFLRAQTYDVSPPTDDRPFFHHYFRLRQTPQILAQFGHIWQPFGGSGFLVLWALLLLVLLASAALVLLPLLRLGSGVAGHEARRLLPYFGLLGLGFLFVEIPLIQRLILFLGHPVPALATVLLALLVGSGLGSLTSSRLPLRPSLATLVLAVLLYPWLLQRGIDLFLGVGLGFRLALSVVALLPLGFLMGVPFPSGIEIARREHPPLIPWAWAINGSASVVSALLAALVGLVAGVTSVFGAAALAYGLGLLAIFPLAGKEERSRAA
ncbi:MAG: hypothetical protein ACE5NC_00850 [Anaerolineae bacterium]